MRRINTTVDVEMNTKSLGDIHAEVRIEGGYSRQTLESPEEFPEATVEQLTLYNEDGEPYDADLDLLNIKVGAFTLRQEIEEKAIEKWQDMDDCGDED